MTQRSVDARVDSRDRVMDATRRAADEVVGALDELAGPPGDPCNAAAANAVALMANAICAYLEQDADSLEDVVATRYPRAGDPTAHLRSLLRPHDATHDVMPSTIR